MLKKYRKDDKEGNSKVHDCKTKCTTAKHRGGGGGLNKDDVGEN